MTRLAPSGKCQNHYMWVINVQHDDLLTAGLRKKLSLRNKVFMYKYTYTLPAATECCFFKLSISYIACLFDIKVNLYDGDD